MSEPKVTNLLGMTIVGQHGRAIGVLSDMSVDVDTWQLRALDVKLNRSTLDELKLKKTWFGTQVIQIPVGEISGATDHLVLKHPLEEMEFSGGTSAGADARTEEIAAEASAPIQQD